MNLELSIGTCFAIGGLAACLALMVLLLYYVYTMGLLSCDKYQRQHKVVQRGMERSNKLVSKQSKKETKFFGVDDPQLIKIREAYEEVSELLVTKQVGFDKTVSSLQLSELEHNSASIRHHVFVPSRQNSNESIPGSVFAAVKTDLLRSSFTIKGTKTYQKYDVKVPTSIDVDDVIIDIAALFDVGTRIRSTPRRRRRFKFLRRLACCVKPKTSA